MGRAEHGLGWGRLRVRVQRCDGKAWERIRKESAPEKAIGARGLMHHAAGPKKGKAQGGRAAWDRRVRS